nr:glycerol-3-phosphate acyltransferase [Gemmatimonadota bacterium]
AAILGHVFPAWLGFRGGKGVATGVGVFLGLSPIATAGAVVVWLVLVGLTRLVSLASLALGGSLPFLVYAEQRGGGREGLLVAFAMAAAAFIFWTHRENVRRLARGEERRIARAPEGSR